MRRKKMSGIGVPREGPPAVPFPPLRSRSSFPAQLLASGAFFFTLFGGLRLSRLLPSPSSEVPLELVFWYAWITCASTALGALPFFLCRARPGSGTLGASNAAAAGMMLAASASLAWEGLRGGSGGGGGGAALPPAAGVLLGAGVGVACILASKRLLRGWGGAEAVFAGLAAADARRALLLVLVMFAHSATEGVAIGVGFTAGDAHVRSGGGRLGPFVALSLAIHNVPEGLATCLALVPSGTPPLEAALWALGTSLSQPLLAVVSFAFVHQFAALLAPGLGFAAGAMAWVAARELLPEAWEQLEGWGARRAPGIAAVAAAAGAAMAAMQALLPE
jgi:ZIP family zinc transporter